MNARFVLSAMLITAALALSLSAADIVVDISSFAPHDPEVVLRQIELNVSIKHYEKAMDDLQVAVLQARLGPEQDNLNAEQQKKWEMRAKIKVSHLQDQLMFLRDRIIRTITEANEKAEKMKLKVETKLVPNEAPGK